MPGTFRRTPEQKEVMGPQPKPQPPPVAARSRTAKVSLQSWSSVTEGELPDGDSANYGHHVRCSSVDSVDSNSGSSVSSAGSHSRQQSGDSGGEFIPTRTVGKTPSLPSHNPLQFVKVQSPLYKKAEHQIKIAKEVKITRDTLKEGEEEWQSNLDNWKSRRRKASEKVFQRAEEMRQIEAEELMRQQQLQQQQRKIRTFSEIIEKRAVKKRNYSLDLYMGQGDDSGVGGTPEPDDPDAVLDGQNSALRSDTSEGMTSETESVDSDARGSDKVVKEPPKVPKKPHSWLSRKEVCSDENVNVNCSSNELLQHCHLSKELPNSGNVSSAEPSDVEGHAADTETVSSEDDAGYCGPVGNVDSGLESLCDRVGDIVDSASDFSQDSCSGLDKVYQDTDHEIASSDELDVFKSKKDEPLKSEISATADLDNVEENKHSIRLQLKQGSDGKGFGFNLKGGKDQGCTAFVDFISPGSPAEVAGLLAGDKILAINGESTLGSSHASLVFSVKQAIYTGQLDLLVSRPACNGTSPVHEEKPKPNKRGVSFAEKLAMFSNSATSNNSSKLAHSLRSLKTEPYEEPKKESLVLRRRSAFENSSAEKESKNRWSFGLCQDHVSIGCTHDDRRRSVEFSSSSSIEETSKKPGPPPVPAKPKLKPKLSRQVSEDSYNPIVEVVHESSSCILSHSETASLNSVNGQFSKVDVNNQIIECSDSKETDLCSVSSEEQTVFSPEHNEGFLSSTVKVPFDIPEQLEQHLQFSEELNVNKNEEMSFISNSTDLSTGCFSSIGSDTNHSVYEGDIEDSENAKSNEVFSPVCGTGDVSVNISSSIEPVTLSLQQMNVQEITINSTESELNNTTVVISGTYTDSSTVILESEHDVKVNDNSEVGSESEQLCHLSRIQINNLDSANESVELNSYPSETECKDSLTDVVDNEADLENEDNLAQISVHPNNLMLEKIDEDDGVSASTSPSSETPDTETIIEHFPTNISPLPNDEAANDTPVTVLNQSNCSQSDELQTVEHDGFVEDVSNLQNEGGIFDLHQFSTTVEQDEDEEFQAEAGDQKEEEWENSEEYDTMGENTHLISPLDVFDQIERKLMQELEQQGDEMLDDMNGQLEDEVNQELLYLSEDASLFDELDAPRNVQPPSEPPPPPPPPEIESNSQMVQPFQRINSTKRIKKELWRRRSDFLGLDSPEGIDVDNIPPPPDLEELLKSEMEMQREQRLWLEKRLSLADSDCNNSTIESTSSTVAQSLDNFNTANEYSPECMLEVYDAEVYDAVHTDTVDMEWKTNTECQIPINDGFPQMNQSESDTNAESLENKTVNDSPQHKAKSHIQSLGAAPRAKIMDSDKWITQSEKHAPIMKQKSVDPVFRDGSYNQNFWLAQDANSRSLAGRKQAERRYSMPPASGAVHPDVTIRTWGDREFEMHRRPRPTSEMWQGLSSSSQSCDAYSSAYVNSQKPVKSNGYYDHSNTPETHIALSHKCSYCGRELCEGSAMGIDTLQLYFHLECFRCCMCQVQLGNGTCGTDVQVKNNHLYCPDCFTID